MRPPFCWRKKSGKGKPEKSGKEKPEKAYKGRILSESGGKIKKICR